jgi:hypothetical protein
MRMIWQWKCFFRYDCGVPQERKKTMFAILFVILLIAWLLGLTAFHVAGGLIHLLLIFAVISLIFHFVRGRSAV